MVATMSKLQYVSRKTLHKYTKFRVKIDKNDEATCWALICREAYKDRMGESIREKVIEYWVGTTILVLYHIKNMSYDNVLAEAFIRSIASMLWR